MESFSYDYRQSLEDVMCPVLVWPFLELGGLCALILQNQFLFLQFLFYLLFILFVLTNDWKQCFWPYFSSLIASFLLCHAYLWCFLLFYDSLRVYFHFQHARLFVFSLFLFYVVDFYMYLLGWFFFLINLHVFSFKSLVLLEVGF